MVAVYRSATATPLDPGPPVAVTSTPRESTAPRRSAKVTGQVGDPSRKWSTGTCSVTQRKSLLPGQARSGPGVAACTRAVDDEPPEDDVLAALRACARTA